MAAAAGSGLWVTLIGCASPGPPLPPTLNLPDIPSAGSITGDRIGDTVHIHWTTPERTTDRLLIKGPVRAEICRDVMTMHEAPADTPAEAERKQREPQGGAGGQSRPCASVVKQTTVKAGAASEAVDTLPPELASGPSRLLIYRVQLKNSAGRTAGASAGIFAVGGDAPAKIQDLRAHPAKAGVVLEWTPEAGASGDQVELERTVVAEPAAIPRQRTEHVRPAASLPISSRDPAEVRMIAESAGSRDPGGAIDHSAEIGKAYRYTAWRVRSVAVGGKRLEVRGPASSTQTVSVEDVFAPDAPRGLVAAPGFAGQGSAAKPAIDLSWEPNQEPRIAGYRVYRRAAGAGEWHRISGDIVATAAYRDASADPGARYEYRITAVGTNGLESNPSGAAEEAAPAP